MHITAETIKRQSKKFSSILKGLGAEVSIGTVREAIVKFHGGEDWNSAKKAGVDRPNRLEGENPTPTLVGHHVTVYRVTEDFAVQRTIYRYNGLTNMAEAFNILSDDWLTEESDRPYKTETILTSNGFEYSLDVIGHFSEEGESDHRLLFAALGGFLSIPVAIAISHTDYACVEEDEFLFPGKILTSTEFETGSVQAELKAKCVHEYFDQDAEGDRYFCTDCGLEVYPCIHVEFDITEKFSSDYHGFDCRSAHVRVNDIHRLWKDGMDESEAVLAAVKEMMKNDSIVVTHYSFDEPYIPRHI